MRFKPDMAICKLRAHLRYAQLAREHLLILPPIREWEQLPISQTLENLRYKLGKKFKTFRKEWLNLNMTKKLKKL